MHLMDLGLGYLLGIDPCKTTAFVMHMKHYARGLLKGFVEDIHEHLYDKVHGGIVVVEQKDLVERRLPEVL
jgi:hypothetical protein